MTQDRTHVHGDAKRNGIEMVVRTSAVDDREIHGLHRRKIHASAKSVVRGKARTASCILAVNVSQIRKRVCSGSPRSRCSISANEINGNPCVNQKVSPEQVACGRVN